MKTFFVGLLALGLVAAPSIGTAAPLIPTGDFSESRSVDRGELTRTLVSLGLSPSEAQSRLEAVSDMELQTMTDEVRAGKGGVYIGSGVILLAILIVLLVD